MSPTRCGIPRHGLKAALHARGRARRPGSARRRPSPGAVDRLAAWVDATYPRLKVRSGGAETCLYTNTPDERFVVERHGRIVVAAACNGQGFQLAPETGRRVAALARRAGRGERPMSDAVERLDECLSIRDGELFVEGCRTLELARRFGTPLYVVSEDQLRRNARRLESAFASRWPGELLLLPSIKANSSLALRRILNGRGDGLRRLWPR